MKLVILKESYANESRVAASPESIKKYVSLGLSVTVEAGAGALSNFSDKTFSDAGASIVKSVGASLKTADIILSVRAPSASKLAGVKKGAVLVATLNPYTNGALIKQYAAMGVEAMSMELMPRITRAQSMDVLSSQSNLAGYKAVLDATSVYNRALPMMMTAAGTVPAARIFVMGAGVAGLQAIATAKRLGAIVTATDVRAAAKEQVESLGGSFVMVETDSDESGETSGGYAKEMSADYQKRQAALVAEHIAKQDIVITTALIPGRPAPELVTTKMVESMKPGSVMVDLAVEQGGNCKLSRAGKVINHKGVHIVAHENVAGRLAGNASELFARNLYNFVQSFWDQEKKSLTLDWEDEIVKGIGLTHEGKVVHEMFAVTSSTKAKPTAKSPAANKPAAKKAAPAAKKPEAKKAVPATKKPAAKAAPVRKTAAKKAAPATKKPVGGNK